MKINPLNPFELFKGSEWDTIKEFADPVRFEELQLLLNYFAGQFDKDKLPDHLHDKVQYQLEDYYNEKFTILFGEILCDLGKRFMTANPTLQFDFSKVQMQLANLDKDIWYCEECGSMDVEIKSWTLPNDEDKQAGNGDLDRNDCWCQNCEQHTKLELTTESKYPEVLNEIQERNTVQS